MSKKKFKTILCGCITTLCLLLTSCGSLQISQGSGNQDSDRGNQTTTETTFASTGNIESVDTLEEVPSIQDSHTWRSMIMSQHLQKMS